MQSTKRPRGVWFILVFYSVAVFYTLLWTWRIYSKKLPVSGAAAEYLQNPGALNHFLTVIGYTLKVAFLVALFKMRRVAITIFTAIIVLTVFSYLWNIFFKNYLSLFSDAPAALASPLVVVAVPLAILGVVYLYLRNLVREGKLT
jgi:hypothetical protein